MAKFVFYWLLEKPIEILYLRGPAIFGYGFWEGLPRADICSRLTGVDSRHWIISVVECDAIIERKLQGMYIALYFAVYMLLLWNIAKKVICKK